MSNDLLSECPIWSIPCIREDCVSYEVHTKQRFYNVKTSKYVPIDQLSFYLNLTPEQLEETIERHITIVRECRQFGKIIQIENKIDHHVPDLLSEIIDN